MRRAGAPRAMLDMRRLLIVALACLSTAPLGAAQSRPSGGDPAWSLEYIVAGGIAFNRHAVRVASDGAVSASDPRLGMDVAGRASSALVATLAAFVRTARAARRVQPAPDQMTASLTLASAGRTSEVEPTPDIVTALDAAWKDAVTHAVEGHWKQSGWKACNPTARLNADALDVPVDDLVFRAGGTFSATWQGSGARKLDDPAVRFEDLRGSYTLDASTGAMHVRPAAGLTPRDFTGDGTFAVAKDTLTLKRVWLGTRSAAARPPICELTFSKRQG